MQRENDLNYSNIYSCRMEQSYVGLSSMPSTSKMCVICLKWAFLSKSFLTQWPSAFLWKVLPFVCEIACIYEIGVNS